LLASSFACLLEPCRLRLCVAKLMPCYLSQYTCEAEKYGIPPSCLEDCFITSSRCVQAGGGGVEPGGQPNFLGVPCRAARLVWGNTSRVQPPPPQKIELHPARVGTRS
jgi:hypothetical protein